MKKIPFLAKFTQPPSNIHVKHRAMVTIAMAMILIVALFYGLGIYFFNEYRKVSLERYGNLLRGSFHKALALENNRYLHLGQELLGLRSVQDKLQAKDREGLYQLLLDSYNAMREKDPNFVIMHFHLPEGSTLLRMHRPQIYGDYLADLRPMVRQVREQQKVLTGFELGKNGVYFRVFIPAFSKEQYLGAMELGFRANFITSSLSRIQDFQLGIFLQNEYIKKKNQSYNFKKIGAYSLLSANSEIFASIPDEFDFSQSYRIMNKNGQTFSLYSGMQLYDFNGHFMAEVIIAHDISADIAQFDLVSMYIAGIFLFLLLVSFFSINYGFNYLISQVEESERALYRQHFKDSLIGLPNRNQLIADLEKITEPTLLLINIDRFKEINEIFGISVGDFVLKEYAATLANYLDYLKNCGFDIIPEKILYRLSRDEFVLLFQNDSISPLEVADFVTTFLKNQIHKKASLEVGFSVTIGIAKDKDMILQKADIALKKAREQKKQYLVFEPWMYQPETVKKNLFWFNKIKLAIAEDRIIPYYQPIFNNKTETIDKYECLIRLVETDGSVWPPHEFLPIVKKTRLYPQLTKIMIEKSVRYFRKKNLGFSINLAPEDMMSDEIIDFIIKNNFIEDCKNITFEILETENISDYGKIQSFIKKVKQLGCKISIDDFGTGYSNFEQLFRLDIDYLKIDGSLVKTLKNDKTSYHLIKNIVNFAAELHIETVAEYVYDEDIYSQIKNMGINYSQGYFIDRPLVEI